VISCVPEPIAVGVYSTEQLDCASPEGISSHVVAGLKAPGGFDVKLTVPVGVEGVPSPSPSVTVAVHVADCETATAGPQSTKTVAVRGAAWACEHASSAQPTARATTETADRPLRPPSRRGRDSP
jgi:hypothetical protein